MPDLEAGEYLLETLFEAGPTRVSGEGEMPLDWASLWAYAQATGALAEPWEFRAVMAMSRAYLSAKHEGKNALCKAPVERER